MNTGKRLDGKTIAVGVTGGIAAHKAALLTSALRKLGATVYVVMTESATHFVQPLTFRVLSQRPVITGMWDAQNPYEEPHVYLGERADLYVIAPATAHTVAKLALGLADDVVSALALATRAPVLLAPAMSDTMYEHPVTQEHLQVLRRRGYRTIGPEVGWLASGKEAIGRMSEPEAIVEEICAILEAGNAGTRERGNKKSR